MAKAREKMSQSACGILPSFGLGLSKACLAQLASAIAERIGNVGLTNCDKESKNTIDFFSGGGDTLMKV